MYLTLRFATATLALGVLPLPSLASSCAEQIGTIERRLDSVGAAQITGVRSERTIRTGSSKALTESPAGDPSDAAFVSTAAGIAEGRGLITRAVQEDGRGDKRACENTMSEAKTKIGALP